LDVRDPEQWSAALATATAAFGGLDVLVNNAGIIHTGRASNLTMAQHRDMVEVNYLGVVAGVTAALPIMRAQNHGHIVNVCSMTSFVPLTGYSTYGATKHAMRAFHHSLAIEERHGPVAFTIIHPPSTRTPMLEQEMADESSVLAFAEGSVDPSEIAEAIVDALDTQPLEVVFPRVMGRVHKLSGLYPALMHQVIPRLEATARKNKAKLLAART
jgi:short-subunit dehydrogenase